MRGRPGTLKHINSRTKTNSKRQITSDNCYAATDCRTIFVNIIRLIWILTEYYVKICTTTKICDIYEIMLKLLLYWIPTNLT